LREKIKKRDLLCRYEGKEQQKPEGNDYDGFKATKHNSYYSSLIKIMFRDIVSKFNNIEKLSLLRSCD
jgi:hypothetical protein